MGFASAPLLQKSQSRGPYSKLTIRMEGEFKFSYVFYYLTSTVSVDGAKLQCVLEQETLLNLHLLIKVGVQVVVL